MAKTEHPMKDMPMGKRPDGMMHDPSKPHEPMMDIPKEMPKQTPKGKK